MFHAFKKKILHVVTAHRKIAIVSLCVFIAFLGIAAFVLFGKNITSSKIVNILQIEPPPLGSDAASIITSASKLSQKENYLAEYDISASSTLDATRSAKYRRIERRLGNLLRIDSNLSDNTPATRYVTNTQGTFLCSFVQEETPQCYDITGKQKEAEQKSLKEGADIDIFNSWQKSGAIKTAIGSQKVQISGRERTCDLVDSILSGKNITEGMLGDITKRMSDAASVSAENIDKGKQILDQLLIVSSNCYDRETGLPVKTIRTTTIGDQKQVSSQTLVSISKDPIFVEKITPKTIITSDSQTFRRLSHVVVDGNTTYIAGELGIYIIKDGKLLKHDEDIYRKAGDVRVLKKFGEKMYLGADRGLFSLTNEKWNQDIDMIKTFSVLDFIEFENSLYAATGNGVFILSRGAGSGFAGQKDSWTQPNASFKNIGSTSEFAIINGKLYVLTRKGVFVYNGKDWSGIVSLDNYGSRRLYSDDNHLFVSTSSSTLEIKNNKPVLVADWKTTGDVFDVIYFKDKIFIGGRKGIYSTDSRYVLKEDEVGDGKDFFIFGGALFAGTDAGVYRYSDTGWFPMGTENMGRIDTFFEKDDVLYAGGLLGLYRFDGSDWIKGLVTDINKFYSVNNRLYVTSNNETFLNELIEEKGDPKKLFDLPSNAKIIKL